MDLASTLPLFLCLVVLQSLTGDFRSSLLVVVLAVGSLDYFLTKPLYSLYMSDPHQLLALAAFAFTSLVITRLVSQVRKEAISSIRQKERTNRLYQLSQELLQLDPEGITGSQLLQPFREHFSVTAICIFDEKTTELQVIGDSDHVLAEKTREGYIRAIDLDDAESRVAVRCLRVGAKLRGAVGFQGLKDAAETAGPLTALTATFLERTNAFREASSAAAATQAEVYRSAILDALAHEFKTPLATILAAAGGIREVGPLEPAQSEMAETVENEAARLGSLTSRLLRTARLQREDIRPRLEPTDLSAMAARMAQQFTVRSRDRRIAVTGDLEPIEVFADGELLRLAVGQLIENACKYSEPGSTISIGVRCEEDFAAVQVSNDGSSIPANEQRHIFERFYRGADARRSTSGSGLGLYVARKIALAHGGTLDLDPAGAAGASVSFTLKLPIANHEVRDEFRHVAAAN